MLRETVEHILQTRMKDDMLAWALENPESMNPLIELTLSDDPKLSWRAAWVLFDAMEMHDARVQPFAEKLLAALPTKKDGHQREIIKILRKLALSDDQFGELYARAVDLWEDTKKAPAVRYYAFCVMLDTAQRWPEIKPEIKALLAFPYVQTLTPGVRRGIQKMAKKAGLVG